MTDDRTVVCRRCGFGNTRGDQFCGSCGVFLEWEGQPVPAQDQGPVPDPDPIPAPPSAVAPDQATAGSTPGAAEPGAPAGLVRCPSCGIANPTARTFCQSCGTTLAGAAPYVERTDAEVAAALAAVSARPPAVPVQPGPPVAKAAAGARKPRGIPGWLVAMAALGIVAGVAIVVGATVLRGEGPASDAGSSPGSSLGSSAGPATASAPAGSGASPAPGDSASPAQSGETGTAVALALTGATASSVVGDRARFQPGKAIDGDPATCWQEGRARERGEWIEVSFAPSRVDSLVVHNGHQASNALYGGNRRLKDVLISVDGGDPIPYRLKDTKKAQSIDLGGVTGATTVRITIVSTYAPKKTAASGTPFDDAALSEIKVMGVMGG